MTQGRRWCGCSSLGLAQRRNAGRIAAVVAAAAAVALALSSGRVAADDTDLFQSELQTGEFSLALKTARELPAGPEQNRALTQLAVAQNAAGDHEASLATIGRIQNDQPRTAALTSADAVPVVNGSFGGNGADFDSLIELITSTVAPSSWDANGGVGTVAPFPGGVYVDTDGVLRRAMNEDRSGALAELRQQSDLSPASESSADVHHQSPLRKISLTRLERAVQLSLAAGQQPTETMQLLAGLERIKYVLVYPRTHDLVLAGPADDWQADSEGRIVAKNSNHPILRLDDLVVIFRYMLKSKDARFGCSITPTAESLAQTKAFLAESNRAPLKPGQRDNWLGQLRSRLGKQTIEVNGIDARTRVGRVMVEADYRMKLVGLGLEDGVLGVPSYLSMISLDKDGSVPPLDVLRWWFTLNYKAVRATSDHDGFEILGQGVKVLSENELLTATGQQIHTGQSDRLNDQFARNFTEHFPELAAKYPIYAELQNMFDLALAGALIRSQGLAQRANWHMSCFNDPHAYAVDLEGAPRSVETVINHRIIGGVHILVGVSGGVSCNPSPLVRPEAIATDYGRLQEARTLATPKPNSPEIWWWD